MTNPVAVADTNSIYVNDADKTVTGNVLDNDQGTGLVLRFLDGVRIDDTGKKGVNEVQGDYGKFTIYNDGSYSYELDMTNTAVTSLASGSTLTEKVGYKVSNGVTDFDYLTITILGPNTKPTAIDDSFTAVNGSVAGNVLANDLDENTATLGVSRAGDSDTFSFVPTTGDLVVEGVYGDLMIDRQGNFTYQLDLSDPDTIALGGTGGVEEFRYRLYDEAFGEGPANANTTDVGSLTISF